MHATHGMGGTVYYKYVGNNRYALEFAFFRDCSPGAAGMPYYVDYSIKGASSSNVSYGYAYQIGSSKSIGSTIANCSGSSYCSEKGIFRDTITLGTDNIGYHIWYSVCCRNGNIDNISGAGSASISWYSFIPERKYKNSSPTPVRDLIPTVCAGRKNIFNAGFYDPDGDSLVFSFVTPYNTVSSGSGGSISFTNLSYKSGYSVNYPFDNSSPAATIDPETGEITASPKNAGNYVLAVKITEYRVDPFTKAATKLSEVRVDIQFISVSCYSAATSNQPPGFVKDTLGYSRRVDPNKEICITINGIDSNTINNNSYDELQLSATGSMFGNISSFPKPYATFPGDTNTKTVSSKFCWKPSCEHITYTSPHLVTFKIKDKGCNELERTYKIYVNPKPFVLAPKLKCVSILGSDIIRLQWDSIPKDTFFKQYVIYRKKEREDEFKAVKILTSNTAISWTDSTAKNAFDTTYQYYIRSANSCEDEGITSDTLTSIVLKADPYTLGKAVFEWNELKTNLKDSFIVEADFGAGFKVYDTVTTRKFEISRCYKKLSIRVKEVKNSKDCNSQSNWVWVADTLPPVKKRIYNVWGITKNNAKISFVKSPSKDIEKYVLQRSNAGGSFVNIATIKHTTSSDSLITYTDLSAGKWPLCYKVMALDSCGNQTIYDQHCPISLTGKTGQLEVHLAWSAYDGFVNKKHVVEYWQNGGWTAIKTLGPNDQSFTHTGLGCQTYYYRIQGQEDASPYRVTYSDSIAVTTNDTISPDAPTPNYVKVTSASTIELSFHKSAALDVKEYRIWVSKNGGTFTALDTVKSIGSATYTYTHKSIDTRNNRYTYRLRAVDVCKGNNSPDMVMCALKFNASNNGNLATKLDWAHNNCITNDKYYIYRWNTGKWSLLDSVPSTQLNYNDAKDLHCNRIVYYRVTAASNATNKYTSYSDSIAVKPYDSIAPQEVDLHSATVVNGSKIKIEFDTVAAIDVNRYVIYAKKNSGSFVSVDTIKNPLTNPVAYIHSGINTLTDTFTYQVKALDSCSNILSKTVEPHKAIQLKGSNGNYANHLNWNKYEGITVEKYVLQRLEGSTWKDLKTLTPADQSYTDEPLTCGQVKYYRIHATEDGGKKQEVYSDTIALTPFDTVKPIAPVINYTTYTSGTHVNIFWTKTISNDVKRYIIYRKNASSSFAAIDTVGDITSYTDTLPDAKPIQYCYAIKSLDSCENNVGAFSAMHCPVNLQADTNICNQKIYSDWTAYIGFAAGVKQYNVYRKEKAGIETLYATVAGNKLAFVDSVVDYKKTYCYRIEAVPNVDTFTSFSSSSCEKTYEPEIPHIIYASKIASSATKGQVQVKWTSVKGKRFYHYYNLFHKTSSDVNFTLIQSNIPVGQDSFIHKNINTSGEDHYYKIAIVDSCGNNKSLLSQEHKTINLEVNVGQLTHKIKWTPYIGFAVDSYYVERLDGGKFQTLRVFRSDTNTVIFPAPCNYNIFYRIRATDTLGNFVYSDTVGRQAIDTIPSNSAILTNASVTSGKSVNIDFIGADSADMYQYVIQRSNNGSWGTAGAVDFTAAAARHMFTDSTNTLNDVLCYTLLTLDSCLNVSYSDTFCVPQLKGQPLNQGTQISWHPFSGYEIKGYKVHKWSSDKWNLLATLSEKDTTFSEDTLHCYVPNHYKVEALGNDDLRVSFSDSITLTPFDTIAPPPAQMRYVNVQDDNKTVEVAWRYDHKSDVKFFEIWRNEDGGTFNKLGTVAYDSSFIDNTANAGLHQHSYYVVSIDSCDVTHRSVPSDTDVVSFITLTNGSCFPVIFLNWSPYASFAKGNNALEIYRREKSSASWLKVADLPANASSHNDTVPNEASEYCYKIVTKANEGNYIATSGTFCYQPWIFPLPDSALMVYTTVTYTGELDGAIQIDWPAYDAVKDTFARGYRLYHKVGNDPFTLIYDEKNLAKTSFTHQLINTVSDINHYYLAVYNVCNREGKASIIHKAVNLDVDNQNLKANLSWNTYKGEAVDKYELYVQRNAAPALLIATLAPTDTNYTDTNLLCKQHYTYQIHAYLRNGKISKSDTVGIDAFDNTPPPAADVFFATVDATDKSNGKISLSYIGNNEKNRSGYKLYRKISSGDFELYRQSNDVAYTTHNFYDDNLNTEDDIHSYYYTALDSCGNESVPSDTHTVVHLKAKATSQIITLNWNAYKGFKNYAYTIEKRENGGVWKDLTILASNFNMYVDSAVKCHQFYEYRIKTTEASSVYFSYSNISGDTAFETVLPIAPAINFATVTQTSQTTGTIRVSWNASVSKDAAVYFVERSENGTDWSPASPITTSLIFDDNNLNTAGQSYYYRVWVTDSCGNVSALPSIVHRSVLLETTPGNQEVKLKWNAYEGWNVKQYNIYRNNALYKTVPGTETQYTDTFVLCINTYDYKVEALYLFDTLIVSASNTDSAKPWDFKPPHNPYFKRVTVSVPNNQLKLEWAPSPSFDVEKYYIYKKSAAFGQYDFIDSTSGLEYTLNGEITQSDCFIIKAKDYCSNLSKPSNFGCTIILDATHGDGYNELRWNAYTTWRDGVETYNVYRKDDDGDSVKIGSTSSQYFRDAFLADDVVDYCYMVEAVEKPGLHNATSVSTVDCVHQDPIVYVPNTFSPDLSVGLNDGFGPYGMYIRTYEMKIFNRWGQLVYETRDGKNWDGKMNGGTYAPDGMYNYKIVIKGHNKGDMHYNGVIYILR